MADFFVGLEIQTALVKRRSPLSHHNKRNKAGAAWMMEIATESIRHSRARGRGPIMAMRERDRKPSHRKVGF